MMTYKLKTRVMLFITGLVIGFGVSLLVFCSNSNDSIPGSNIISPEIIRKQVAITETKFQNTITDLEKKNGLLEKDLQATKVLLLRAKKQTDKRRSTIKKMTEPVGFPAKELLQKVGSQESSDSNYSPCDSLKEEVKMFLQENIVKDSLYESQIGIQDSIIAGKDSVIEVHNKNHAQLQSLVTQSVQQQELLLKENKQLRKQAKRQKFKSTIKTIGLMVLSGFTVKYLINH